MSVAVDTRRRVVRTSRARRHGPHVGQAMALGWGLLLVLLQRLRWLGRCTGHTGGCHCSGVRRPCLGGGAGVVTRRGASVGLLCTARHGCRWSFAARLGRTQRGGVARRRVATWGCDGTTTTTITTTTCHLATNTHTHTRVSTRARTTIGGGVRRRCRSQASTLAVALALALTRSHTRARGELGECRQGGKGWRLPSHRLRVWQRRAAPWGRQRRPFCPTTTTTTTTTTTLAIVAGSVNTQRTTTTNPRTGWWRR